MIVVVGSAAYRPDPATGGRAAGFAPEIAAHAAMAGASVELLARVGEDGAGEELLLALARSGVGHLAVLRDPSHPTPLAVPDVAADDEGDPVPALLAEEEADGLRSPGGARHDAVMSTGAPVLDPADVALGLRYLRDFGVIVAVEPIADGGAAVIAKAAAFAGAALVVVAPSGPPPPDAYAAATLIEAPEEDPEGAFARLVGTFAAALDRGVPPADAFRGATEGGGWESAAG